MRYKGEVDRWMDVEMDAKQSTGADAPLIPVSIDSILISIQKFTCIGRHDAKVDNNETLGRSDNVSVGSALIPFWQLESCPKA